MFLSIIGFVFFLLLSQTTSAEVFILKDGRIFEANNFNEKDEQYFINMQFGMVQINKKLVKKIVGPSAMSAESHEMNLDQINYNSINSVLILKTGQLLITKKTYAEDDFVICETKKGTNYYKKDDVEDIINPKNIIVDNDSFMAPDNKRLDKKATFPEVQSNVFILKSGKVFEANDFFEKDGHYFINRKYDSFQIDKYLVKKIVCPSAVTNIDQEAKFYLSNYQSINSVAILRTGQLLVTKKTYIEDNFVVCKTSQGTKLLKKEDVIEIVGQKCILTDKDSIVNPKRVENISCIPDVKEKSKRTKINF
jgi:hypothetical protein